LPAQDILAGLNELRQRVAAERMKGPCGVRAQARAKLKVALTTRITPT